MSILEKKTDRKPIYVIGGRKAKDQIKAEHLIECVDGYCYTIGFGIDDKGQRYMVLAEKVEERGDWHGAYRSCGHWHSSGYRYYIKGWNVFLRKNFKDAEEGNKYFKIVSKNMCQWHVNEAYKKFTEEQFNKLFA